MNTTQTTFGDRPLKLRKAKTTNIRDTEFYPLESTTPKEILLEAKEKYNLSPFYALSSGGGDSMTVADMLAEAGMLEAVVHIKTNIGLKMTTDFLRDECQRRGWKLHMIEPIPSHIFMTSVQQFGFPGPHAHRIFMSYLKFGPMRNFYKALKNKQACLVGGIRKTESKRRTMNFKTPLNRNSSIWFCNPIFYMSDEEMYRQKITRGIKVSPAYEKGLGFSGECMCGAYAQAGEKEFIRKHDPELAAYIAWLEEGVRKFGTPRAKKFATWGATSSMTDLDTQNLLDEFMKDNPDAELQEMLACGTECGPGTMRGMTDI